MHEIIEETGDNDVDGAAGHAHDEVSIRTLRESDLDAIVDIDDSIMKRRRTEYFRDKVTSALRDSRIHLSLVAEIGQRTVGFLMARVHYGEFGRPEPTAVVDSIGVHAEFTGQNVGGKLMSEFIRHARLLDIERIRTEVAWDDIVLVGFLSHFGFGPSGRLVLEKPLGE